MLNLQDTAYMGSTVFKSISLIPKMTSNVLPSGICSAQSEGAPAYFAFDNNNSTGWSATTTALPQWCQYYFSTGISVVPIAYQFDQTFAVLSTAWQMQASLDGSTWVTLDTQSSPINSIIRFNNNVKYTYWRLNITATINSGIPATVETFQLFY